MRAAIYFSHTLCTKEYLNKNEGQISKRSAPPPVTEENDKKQEA